MSFAPYMLMSAGPEVVFHVFRFQINGTSDPDFQMPAGAVVDVVRQDAGDFDIEYKEKFPVLLGVMGSVMEATPEHDLQVKADLADYDASTGVLSISIVGADGTPIDEDPADDDWVFVVAAFGKRNIFFETAGAL